MKKFLLAGMVTLFVLMLALSVSIAEGFEPEEPKQYVEAPLTEKHGIYCGLCI